jgi:type I restriction enzyme R subunit
MADNFDQQDLKFVSLREELERLFKKKKLNEVSQEEMTANMSALNEIYDKAKELNIFEN